MSIGLLAVSLLLTGCGGTKPAQSESPAELPGEEYDILSGPEALPQRQAVDQVFSLNFDPDGGCNPLRASSSANMQFWSLIYDSVFTVDENFEFSSEIVKNVRSDDYTWWVFDMNEDICFSDGTPLTAADVVYSIRYAAQREYYRGRLSMIYGVSALSSYSFAITTAYADTMFPAMLNVPIIKYGEYYEDWPIGSGPYVLREDHRALELNPENRHASEMPIGKIYLRDYMDTSARITAFENASIDIVTNDPTGMYNLGYGSSNEKRYYDTTNLHYIGFNMKGMYFQNPHLRYALGYAIDREWIVSDLMNGCGVPTTLPVHPKSALYDEAYAANFNYDPEKAAALFQAGGIGDLDDDGLNEVLVTGIVVEMNIKFIVNNDSASKVTAARRICEELNAMGVTTKLYELTWEDYFTALVTGDYDMYYGELRLTPDWNLSELFKERDTSLDYFAGLNYARNTDETYCELYSAYLAAPESERDAAFHEVLKFVAESAPILPICFERREVLTHRGVVGGIRATQYDLFHQFSEWTIDLK